MARAPARASVPRRGLEPPRRFRHQILSLACLPVSAPGQVLPHPSRMLPRGLEPPRACAHWILNPARLPIPPQEHTTPDPTHAPGEIRTPGLLIRSQALYPAELRAQDPPTRKNRPNQEPTVHREGIEPSTLGLRVPCSAS